VAVVSLSLWELIRMLGTFRPRGPRLIRTIASFLWFFTRAVLRSSPT